MQTELRLASAASTERSTIRVLHVITRMVRGGAQENTLATVLGLNGGVWRSTLAAGPATGPEGSLEQECTDLGAAIVGIPELVREPSPRRDLLALKRLVALFRRERPHLVHTHTSKAGILGRLAARTARVPAVVHTPHGHVFHSYEGGLKTGLFIRAERACAPMADRLVALTETEMREHLEAGVGERRQWTIVHSGVDFAPFEKARAERDAVRAELRIDPESVVLGTVGRLVPIKGQAHLLDAAARLSAAATQVQLLIVGDGPLRQELRRQAASLGFRIVDHTGGSPPGPAGQRDRKPRPTIHFTGLRRDVARLMAAMDIFVLPSLNEGMGRVLVEAMAMELPCVASRVSGIPDVVDDGRTGMLVTPRDPQALAAALALLMLNRERARQMGLRGREKVVPAWGVECMVSRLADLYREVLEEKGIAV